MALPEYPRGVPYEPNVDGFRDSPAPYIQRTEFEGGNSRQRLRRSVHGRAIEMSLTFTDHEKDLFEEFWLVDLAYGSARFAMPIWVGKSGRGESQGEWIGEPWTDHEVQIRNGAVSYRWIAPNMWNASFTLEVIRQLP